MLTSLIEKFYEHPKYFYVLGGAIFVMLVVFIIFVMVNNRLNRRSLIPKEKEAVKEIYILEILYGKNKVRIYDKKNYQRMFTYTIPQMHDLIQTSDLEEWEEWIKNIKKEKVLNPSHIIIKLLNPMISKMSIVRVNFEQLNKETKAIYCNFEVIPIDNKTNSHTIPNLTNTNEFMNILENEVIDIKKPVGAFIIFDFFTIDSIKRRYDSTIANDCLFEMMRRLKELIDDSTYVSYFGNNSFYIYKKGITKKEDAIEYMKDIYDGYISMPITANKYSIEPHFNVGVALFGEYTFDKIDLFKNTRLALTQGNNKYKKLKFGYYDFINESINLKYTQNSDKLRQLISGDGLNLLFEPMVSLSSLSMFGYYYRFDGSFTEENGFQTYLQIAKALKIKDEYISKFVISILDKCVEEMPHRSRVILKIDIDSLELVKNIIMSNLEYLKLKIIIVFDYEQVLQEENANIVRKIHEEFNNNGFVEFGVIADENMITVYSNVLSLCNYIVLDEFMLSGIEIDDMKKIAVENIIENTTSFSEVQFIARGVKKYEQARTLQKMGVMAISGSYIQEPLNNLKNNSFLKNRPIQRLYEHE